MSRFDDRSQAGELLAMRLLHLAYKKPVVLALPRGGLPVAAEIARVLGAPLDILAVKKIGLPQNPEFAIGAVSEDGVPLIDEEVIQRLEIDPAEVDEVARKKILEAKDQARMFRSEIPLQPVGGRHVIVVDDGLATGATMEAAIRVLHSRRAAKITVAVPVASKQAAEKVKGLVDEFVCLETPEQFYAVGQWYESFEQVTDQEAMEFLRRGRPTAQHQVERAEIEVPVGRLKLNGSLAVPPESRGIVIFAHGSGSSRFSPRNRKVADALNATGFATLLFDLLTEIESEDRSNVFDIKRLARRLIGATDWAVAHYPNLPNAYFGASTGAGAALEAAAAHPKNLFAVVSRGGRADMAEHLEQVDVPALLIVGGNDEPVLSLNHQAAKRIKDSRVAVVPGAGHLFEEPGALDEVIEYAIDWLLQSLSPAQTEGLEPKEAITREIKRLARPLRNEEDLRRFADRIADARIVMMGEATHGTQEFYEIRRKLSQYLLSEHDFNFIAVEGDWPDCHSLSRYISSGEGHTAKEVMSRFHRWPRWMWANTETVRLIEWMRRHHQAGFYGLDVYSLFDSIEVIRKHMAKFDAEFSQVLADRYACFEPFARDEIAYARSLLSFPEGCRQEVIANLRALLSVRLDESRASHDELFDLQQNARVIANAENYYRAMLRGDEESWNVRDEHMLETLQVLLKRYGSNSKAIVWAHNTHIGDYHATDMAKDGYVNIGGLTREAFGADQVCLVGFGTYQGNVLAGHAWGAREEVMPLAPARAGSSFEHYFHNAACELKANQLACLFDQDSKKGALGGRFGQRAVGVVYHPDYEQSGRNYVPTRLSHRYDAFIFVDKTTALKPLHGSAVRGLVPETWPAGQ